MNVGSFHGTYSIVIVVFFKLRRKLKYTCNSLSAFKQFGVFGVARESEICYRCIRTECLLGESVCPLCLPLQKPCNGVAYGKCTLSHVTDGYMEINADLQHWGH